MKIWLIKLPRFYLVLILAISPLSLRAEAEAQYELSGRVNIVGATGEPTNDMLGIGVTLHRKLSDAWYLGFGLDLAPEFDFETPNKLVGISSVGEIDASGSMTMLSVVGERRYALDSQNWTGFWNLGVGISEIDVDDVDGPVVGGGSFDIETSTDTEFVLLGSLGMLQRLGENWSARYALTVEQHLADWKVEDRISGKTGSVDDYTVSGLRIGLNYQF